MEFERLEWDKGAKKSTTIDNVFLPADDVILAIGQENAFPWIERDIGIEFDKWDMPTVDEKTTQCTRDGIFFGGDAAWGPKNIIWAVEHGHQAAISIHNYCQGTPVTERLPQGMNLISQKMGLSEWSYHNDYNPAARQKMRHVDLVERFKQTEYRSRAGFLSRANRSRSAALSQLRHRNRLHRRALHRMRRLHRRMSGAVPHHRARRAKKTIFASAFPPPLSISLRISTSRLRCRRPHVSWPRMKTFAYTAAFAPNAAPRRPGICKSLNF